MAYSPERRSAVIARMLAPNSVPLTRLAKEEGIALGTLLAVLALVVVWPGFSLALPHFLR